MRNSRAHVPVYGLLDVLVQDGDWFHVLNLHS